MLRRVVLLLSGLGLVVVVAVVGLLASTGDPDAYDFNLDVAEEVPPRSVSISLPLLTACVAHEAPDHAHLRGRASYRAIEGNLEFAAVTLESPVGIGSRDARRAVDALLDRFALDAVVGGAVLLHSSDRDLWAMSLVGTRDLPAGSVALLLDDTVPDGWGAVSVCGVDGPDQPDPVSEE